MISSFVAVPKGTHIDIVFDGPPAAESGRFVEVENPAGASVKVGEWIDRGDGLWALRISFASPEAILGYLDLEEETP